MEGAKRPRILIIIVNFNNAPDTIACVESILATEYPSLKIFLADSASEDLSRSEMERRFGGDERITLSFLPENKGFAAAVNEGFKYCLLDSYEFVLLLNNDTVVRQNVLDEMVATVRRDASVGIVGGKILFHGTQRLYSAGGMISYLRNVGHLTHYGKQDSDTLKGEIGSTFVSACLMLIRRQVIETVGLLDEGYFMYMEDVDYCFRAQRRGWKIRTNLDAVIWHKEGGSSSPLFSAYWAGRNRLRFIDKNLKGMEKAGALVSHLLSKPISYIKIGDRRVVVADLRGARDYVRLKISGKNRDEHALSGGT